MKLIYDKIPFMIFSAVFLVVTLYSRSTDIVSNKETFSIIERVLFATYGLAFYVFKLFVPINLSVINPFPQPDGGSLPALYYLSILILPVFFLLIIKSGKLKKDMLFGIAFFIINLLIVLQILPYGYSVVSERYVYLPYLGLFLIIGQVFTGIYNYTFNFSRKIKPFAIPVFLLIVTLFSVMTYSRSEVWKDPLTLAEDAATKQPDSYYAHYSRGVAYALFHDNEKAMSDYSKAIELNPKYAEAFSARALLFDAMNDAKSALADYNKALAILPFLTDTYYDRGNNKLKAERLRGRNQRL